MFNTVTSRPYKTEVYEGKDTKKAVELRFDFIAPVHCSEKEAKVKCNNDEEPIKIEADITKVRKKFFLLKISIFVVGNVRINLVVLLYVSSVFDFVLL